MKDYRCTRCLKVFRQKSNYDYHTKRKLPCKSITESNITKIPNAQLESEVIQIAQELIQVEHNLIPVEQKLIPIEVNPGAQKVVGNHKTFECQYCKKDFSRQHSLDRHLKNNSCKIKRIQENQKLQTINDEDTKEIEVTNMCQYCKLVFSTSSSLQKHLKNSCNIKRKSEVSSNENINDTSSDTNKEDYIKELKATIASLTKKNDEYKNRLAVYESTNINIQNNNQIQNQQNIKQLIQNNNNLNVKLLAFGKEDMTHLADEIYKKILNKGFKSVPELVEFVHFNKDKPENHNIYISNMQNNYILVYDGTEWNLKERNDILQQLTDDKIDLLSEKFEALIDRLDDSTINKFNRFIDKKEDDKIIADIKNDLKLILYNKRKIAEKTREILQVKNDKLTT